MNKLILKNLIIFEPKSKLGKKVSFVDGVNVITSSQANGNKVGKSIIMKSIYHTLGADCFFDDMWTNLVKLYYLEFLINDCNYSIYRNERLFKIYKEGENILSTVDRNELSLALSEIYNFKVLLPDRTENELVLTPPSFSYLLNYTDQDYMNGSKFMSFDKLGQFAGFKENTIYNHFGIFSEEYFKIAKSIEGLKKDEKELIKDKEIIENMLQRVDIYLDGSGVPTSIEALEEELQQMDDEYAGVINVLNKIKMKLTSLRNEKIELNNAISTLTTESDIDFKSIKKLRMNECPTCNQKIEVSDLIIDKSNHFEDLIIVKQELESALIEVDFHLKQKRNEYQHQLLLRSKFEKKISINNSSVSNVLEHMGYTQTRDKLLQELGSTLSKISLNEIDLKEKKKKLKEFNEIKTEANNTYYQSLLSAKDYFGLEEIDDESFNSIRLNFTAGGSNKPLATIMWHIALLKVKYSYNKSSLRFPIVFDSPNNVEADDSKKHDLLFFIFKNYDKNSQLVVSSLGFESNEFEGVKIDKIINLSNDKYKLLNENDYSENIHILHKVYENSLDLEKL